LAEAVLHMTRILAHEVSKTSQVFVDAVGCNGPEYVLQNIKDKISKVERDDSRRFRNILDRVKATCFKLDKEDNCPDYGQGADHIVAHLEVCIFK